MCTVTWWRSAVSYGLLFNRDESRRRREALAPAVRREGGCSIICPIDTDGGGTWIWVNRSGLIGCLLNNYDTAKEPPPDRRLSRGLLLLSLACQDTVAELGREVGRRGLDCFRGFFLLGFAGRERALFCWDGIDLDRAQGDEVCCPLTTSGYRPDEVRSYRLRRFQDMVGDPATATREDLQRFHLQHDPACPAVSVLMSRPASRTVSYSSVTVTGDAVSLSYAPVSEALEVHVPVTTTLSRW